MEELNLVFKSTGGPYGDCTCTYDVTLNRACTVKELIDAVLKRKEWGYIGIKVVGTVFGSPRLEYRNDAILCSEFRDEDLNRKVRKIFARGGWTNMNYLLELEG